MCQVSSSAWTAQNHRPQMPQWDVAAELQGSSIGETASQDHSRLQVSVWFDCCNISPPRAGSIHLAVVAEFQWEITLSLEHSLPNPCKTIGHLAKLHSFSPQARCQA